MTTDDPFSLDGVFTSARPAADTAAFSTGTLLASLAKTRAALDALPRPEFDCVACTPAGLEWLKAALPPAKREPETSPFGPSAFAPLYGMPVHVADDVASLYEELRRAGKRPYLLTEGKP